MLAPRSHSSRQLNTRSISQTALNHDDVIKWKHFSRYWHFVQGIHRSLVNSPHKSQWRGALMFSLICAWTNGWVNTPDAGDLRRHRANYDVTVMWKWSLFAEDTSQNNRLGQRLYTCMHPFGYANSQMFRSRYEIIIIDQTSSYGLFYNIDHIKVHSDNYVLKYITANNHRKKHPTSKGKPTIKKNNHQNVKEIQRPLAVCP